MMACRLHLADNMADAAFGVYHVGDTMNTLIAAAHHLLFAPNSVGFNDFVIFIGQQIKIKAVRFLEFFELLDRVAADAEDNGFELFERVFTVTDAAGLGGAARC